MTRKYKIAVYAISKNEEQFVDRWMDCIVDEADMVIVSDTGSTDNTVEKLKARGAVVHEIKVVPWRFDVARNISMHFVPKDFDICVSIDLDETLTPGWRQAIEDSWEKDTSRLRYMYYWSVNADGSPGVSYWYDKIHSRNGYLWHHPVHETLKLQQGFTEKQTFCKNFILKHFPDFTKSRAEYLPLLELSIKEDPLDDRNSHYLGREYMFKSEFDKAIVELKRHLTLEKAKWLPERASSMRFIGRCYQFKNEMVEANRWFLRSVAESPVDREPWVELAKNYYNLENYNGCYFACKEALKIKERPESYICEPFAWDFTVYDYAAISAWKIGSLKEALEFTDIALSMLQAGSHDYIRLTANKMMILSI